MTETISRKASSVDADELARWLDRVNEPWNPITAARRQLDDLIEDTETPPVPAAYDHLHEMASLAVRWLDLNPCPDEETGRRFTSQMMAYRTVAATVRSRFSGGDGATAAQLVDLRRLLDQYTAVVGW